MSTLTIQQLTDDPNALLRLIEMGEEVVLTRDGRPVASVQSLAPQPRGKRPFGLARGEFLIPADIDLPLPDEITEAFAPQ